MPRRSKIVDPAGGPLHVFAHEIGARRDFLNLSLADVVERARGEFRQSALNAWERAISPPSNEQQVRALAAALDLDAGDLVRKWELARNWYRSLRSASLALPGELLKGTERFVGRRQLLGELGVSWTRVQAGECRTVLVAGNEANGKTWLLGEFARRVHAEGAIVLYGRSREPETAFQPIADALRPYCRARPGVELVAEAGKGASALAGLIEEMEEKCRGLLERSQRSRDRRDEQRRLFDAVESLLVAAACRAPVLVVLDDLHLATRDTLDLLSHLVQPRETRLLIVAAYRNRRGAGDRPLDGMLPQLRSMQEVGSVTVPGLTLAEVEARVALPAKGSIDSLTTELAQVIYKRTNGESLCVDLMVEGLVERGLFRDHRWLADALSAPVPEGLTEAVRKRLSRVSDPVKHALRMAAVIGQTFSLRLLEAILDAASMPVSLNETLEEAIRAGILEPARQLPGHGSFVHDLFREVICEELEELLLLSQHHLAVADGYRALPPSDESVAGMATHYYQARPMGRVGDIVRFNVEAAQRAFRALAFGNAVACLDRARDVLDQDDACRDRYEAEIHLWLAKAKLALADLVGSREAAVSAADAARRVGTPELLGEAAVVLTDWIDFGEPHWRTIGVCEEALEALVDGHIALRARVMAGLAQAMAWSLGETLVGDELAREALSLARAADDQEVLVNVLCCRAGILQGSEQVEEQLERGNEALALAEKIGHVRLEAVAHAQLGRARLELADLEALANHIDALERLARGERAWLASTIASMFRTVVALLTGQFEEVEGLATQMRTHIPTDPTFCSVWAGQMLFLGYEQGRLADLEQEVRSGMDAATPGVLAFRAGLALFLLEAGNPDAAESELEALADDGFSRVRKDPARTGTLALIAESVARMRAVSHAERLYEILLPHAQRFALVSGAVCLGAVDRFLGMLAAVLEHSDDAERHFEAAVSVEEGAGARPHLARTRLWYARMLIDRGGSTDRSRAMTMLRAALEEAQSLGMRGVAAEAQGLLSQQSRTRIVPRSPR